MSAVSIVCWIDASRYSIVSPVPQGNHMTTSESSGPLTNSVEKLRHELDKWLDVAWNQGERAMDAIGLKPSRSHTVRLDLIEDSEQIRVLVSLPGVAVENIDLTLTGNMLTVSGAFPSLDLGVKGVLHAQERPVGEFSRSIPLPAEVDASQISAESCNGVLLIRVAKATCAKAVKIAISSGGTSTSGG